MTTYYADFDLTTGNNTGVDATNAWKTMADVIAGSNGTAPAAGDTILCKGTDTTSSVVSWTASGSAASGYIKLIGVDASWGNVGGSTRAVIDRNGGASHVLSIAGSYIWLENIEITGAGASGTAYDGINFPSGGYRDYCVLVNCYSHHNYGEGFEGNGGYCRYATFIKCRSSYNSVSGFADFKSSNFYFCRADNNTSNGFYTQTGCIIYGCVTENNGGDGIYNYYGASVINCVCDSNTGYGITYPYYANTTPIVCLRTTSNSTGFSYVSTSRMPVFYYYGDNTTETSGYYDEVFNDGSNTITLNGSDTDGGYVDSSTGDYSTATGATYRRVAVSVP